MTIELSDSVAMVLFIGMFNALGLAIVSEILSSVWLQVPIDGASKVGFIESANTFPFEFSQNQTFKCCCSNISWVNGTGGNAKPFTVVEIVPEVACQ